jgi:hypothetical protein
MLNVGSADLSGCNFAEGRVVPSVCLLFFVLLQYRLANSDALIAGDRLGHAIVANACLARSVFMLASFQKLIRRYPASFSKRYS